MTHPLTTISNHFNLRSLLTVAVFLGILVVFLLKISSPPTTQVRAGWFDDRWNYRVAIGVSNPTAATLTNLQIGFTLNTAALITAGKMQSNCNDIRIVDSGGHSLPFWVDTYNPGCNQTATKIWTKVTTIPTTLTYIYVYYGNLGASNAQNGSQVFLFFEDFTGSTAPNWTSTGTLSFGTNQGRSSLAISQWAASTYYNVKTYSGAFTLEFDGYLTIGNQTLNAYFYETPPLILGGGNGGGYAASIGTTVFTDGLVKNGVLIGTNTSHSTSTNTWHNFKITSNGSGTFNFLNDGTSVATATDTSYTSGYFGFSQTGGGSVYVDAVHARQYIATDPTTTYGSEEKSGPIAYWHFNEGVGTSTYDSTGNTNNLFITNATWQSDNSCSSGKCLSFNGTNSVLATSAYNTIFDNTSGVTISAWIKTSSTSSNNIIFSKYGASASNLSYMLVINGDNANSHKLSFYANGWRNGNKVVDDGQWHHVAAVSTGSTWQLYVDGVLDASGSGGSISVSTSTAAIGGPNSNGWGGYFTGSIDEVKVYPYARSAAQVATDSDSGHGSSSLNGNAAALGGAQSPSQLGASGPIGYWNFEDGTGTTASDRSGNNYSASFAVGNSSPTWTTGKYGKALSFSGSQYATITSLGAAGTSDYTISAWVKLPPTSGAFYVDNRANNTDRTLSLFVSNSGGHAQFLNDGPFCFFGAQGTTDLRDNHWHYLTGIRQSTSNYYIYVDGLLQGTNNSSQGSGCQSSTADSTSPWQIGRHGAWGNYSNGLNDELRIYNYARSQKQIIEDMNAGHPAGGSPVGSMIDYWKFNEGTGTSVYDSTPQASNGLITGAAWTPSGIFGRALSFTNGSSTYVTLGNTAPLTGLTSAASVSMWVNPNTTNTGGLFDRYTAGNGNTGPFYLWWQSSKFRFTVANGSTSNNATSPSTYPLNTWYHVVGTFDGSFVNLYVNGTLVTSAAQSITPLDNTRVWNIGSMGGSSLVFGGLISQVKVYNYALTADEVKIDYNRNAAIALGSNATNTGSTAPPTSQSAAYCVPGDTTSCAPPVAEWNFEEGSGTSAFDTASNTYSLGNDLGSPAITSGKIGKAREFLTSGQTMKSPNGSITLDPFTAEAWIYPYTGGFAGRDIPAIIGLWNTTNNHDFIFYFHWQTNQLGLFRGGWGTNNRAWDCTNSGCNISLNTWSHVSVVAYDTNNVNFYVNGILVQSLSAPTSTQGTATYATTGAYFGPGGQNGWTSSYWNGKIDQLKVFNYARTPAQVAWDYSKGGPIAWYKFNECQGNSAYSSAGVGNTGLITIGAGGSQSAVGTCTTAGTAWGNGAQGKFGASLNFDGTDDYVTIGTTLSQINTLSFWTKPSAIGTSIIALNSTTYVSVNSSGVVTAPGFSSPTIYVNGTTNNNVAASQWSLVTISTGTTVNANNITIAKIGSSYYSGQIDDVRLYNYALTPDQVDNIYNEGAATRFGPNGNP